MAWGWLQAYVAWLDGGTAIFAFRGTESGKDAQTDADARSRPIPWMEDLFPKTRGHAGVRFRRDVTRLLKALGRNSRLHSVAALWVPSMTPAHRISVRSLHRAHASAGASQ